MICSNAQDETFDNGLNT